MANKHVWCILLQPDFLVHRSQPKSPPLEGTFHSGGGNLSLLTTNDSIIVV
jgi:hypothetical protein